MAVAADGARVTRRPGLVLFFVASLVAIACVDLESANVRRVDCGPMNFIVDTLVSSTPDDGSIVGDADNDETALGVAHCDHGRLQWSAASSRLELDPLVLPFHQLPEVPGRHAGAEIDHIGRYGRVMNAKQAPPIGAYFSNP